MMHRSLLQCYMCLTGGVVQYAEHVQWVCSFNRPVRFSVSPHINYIPQLVACAVFCL